MEDQPGIKPEQQEWKRKEAIFYSLLDGRRAVLGWQLSRFIAKSKKRTAICCHNGRVAQLGERRACIPVVAGSIPVTSTKIWV